MSEVARPYNFKMWRKAVPKDEGYPVELSALTNNEEIHNYITFLRTQIRHLGQQIDQEFEQHSELIFR